MGHLDPEHASASLAQRRRQPVDRGYDAARSRHRRKSDRVVHKGVLQVDDNQRRPHRVDIGEGMLRPTAFDHALCNRVRDGRTVQSHRNSPIGSGRCRRVRVEQLGIPQIRPQRRRNRIAQKAQIGLEFRDTARTRNDRRDSRVGERKLQRRRR